MFKKKHSPHAGRLKQLTRFERLSDAQIQKIADASTHVTLPANWSLIWEKTPADKAYMILDGEVSIRKSGHEIARLGPGDVIGEVAIVNHSLRTASVVSLSPLEVLHFTHEAVQELSEEIPEFARALATTTAERLERDQADKG